MTKIGFSEYGRVFVNIYVKPNDNITLFPVEFKVDTGADFTTISKISLIKLGYSKDWIDKNMVVHKDEDMPTTASGDKINAGYIQLPLINILGYEGKQWPFQVILDDTKDFRNLLGRDLLTGFNYSFNNDEDVFTIAGAKEFKPLFSFLPGQQINEVNTEQ